MQLSSLKDRLALIAAAFAPLLDQQRRVYPEQLEDERSVFPADAADHGEGLGIKPEVVYPVRGHFRMSDGLGVQNVQSVQDATAHPLF